MIKKITSFILLIITFVFSMPLLADDECDQSLKDAKDLYNDGKYKEAKELFVYVQQICKPTYQYFYKSSCQQKHRSE
jgi:hypothetical protein